jgi:hypothetical protein
MGKAGTRLGIDAASDNTGIGKEKKVATFVIGSESKRIEFRYEESVVWLGDA